ncbi:MAG: hydantoinase B/oxoprolinase family protein [Alphaproteobacteria bacterium]|nr:hydantoinase B/oxoprolinase family protein [Alphaproteobacteria bacterium]
MARGWQFWIDRGGTFTDVVARRPDGTFATVKMLSENPERYRDAAVAGILSTLGLPLDAAVPAELVDQVKMGTTVATNALLERKGAATLLVVNAGFADLLEIGHQARPRLFDLAIRKPVPLYRAVEEVHGRVDVHGRVLAPLDEDAARAMLARRRAEGFEACAIALIHAWRFPEMEKLLAELAREAGFYQVCVSHAVSPLLGLASRAGTTVADAYLTPVLRRYVDRLAKELGGTKLYFMQSNGGLADAALFQGKDAILSGPAGGVVGAARTAQAAGIGKIIGFDMGGTSTDVSLYAGEFRRALDTEIAGVAMRVPMMAINTVAAGGGSILHFDGSRFRVGPDSAAADPGPACYRRGGPLTVTDANVLVGKIQPRHFPAIFGPRGDLALDAGIVAVKFEALAREMAAATGRRQEPRAVAEGFLRIAVANMAQAIKQISLEKGHDLADFTLHCFGGAAGQHACLVADELGMDSVLIHPLAGVLSAYGMGLADQSLIRQQAIERRLDENARAEAETVLTRLAAEATAMLAEQAALSLVLTADLRYEGTDTALGVPFGPLDAMRQAFDAAHRRCFGFSTPERAIVVESVTAEIVRHGEAVSAPVRPPSDGTPPVPIDRVSLWSGGRAHDVPVHDRDALRAGDRIGGPAIVREAIATTVVEPGWIAEMGPAGELLLRRAAARERQAIADAGKADPVLLELFNNLFMAVAERMGVVLRNTSTSVNIKERLDFSCALFDAEGNLVANAPHVPVHLGAMGESVRTVLACRRHTLKPGDMVVLNNPFNGGTHLPDVTVIAPVFDETGDKIRFFVGNRGHHADIGGTTPGSTPPGSTALEEEGVVIDDFLLLDGGVFREREFRALLAGALYPARSPDTNVSDIRAQIAANETGIRELAEVVARYGWPVVEAYMRHVMANAEESVRRVIDRIGDGAFDYEMDDGSRLKVAVKVDHARREAVIDFTGTGAQRRGNFNAPPAVTRAVVLFVFRCLIGDDIPLNEGCLKPLRIVVPQGSFLAPRPGSAVVAGNTEVSQAICNALLGALGASAASQGTMNNFLFGNARYQYYETICGGAGAGPGFDGACAVHTQMTNTRITDPEVLELRFPVRLETFAVRRGSGGAGVHRGGNGVVRRIRALEAMTASLVASRRTVAPFGLEGGSEALPGRQWIERADGRRESLFGVAEVGLEAGDAIVIETPGGGGFGKPGGGVTP